jgi:hypothetical protein
MKLAQQRERREDMARQKAERLQRIKAVAAALIRQTSPAALSATSEPEGSGTETEGEQWGGGVLAAAVSELRGAGGARNQQEQQQPLNAVWMDGVLNPSSPPQSPSPSRSATVTITVSSSPSNGSAGKKRGVSRTVEVPLNAKHEFTLIGGGSQGPRTSNQQHSPSPQMSTEDERYERMMAELALATAASP